MSQTKLANLGSIVRCLERAVPHLLQQTIPPHIVHSNITFELFPETRMLRIHGVTAYKTAHKMIQLGVIPWLIPSGSKLCIISSKLSDQPVIEDRRLWIHWRSISPENLRFRDSEKFGSGTGFGIKSLEPGRLIDSLGLLPREFPVLAGSFEFGFDSNCEKIILHILRNVEYMTKPDEHLICT